MSYFTIFSTMRSEVSLLTIILFLLVYDLIAGKKGESYFQPVAILLFTLHTIFNLFPAEAGEAFGGMVQYHPVMTIIKTILNVGTLIIFLQSKYIFDGNRMKHQRGEYYFLTLSTLLGMYLMISSGHFLLFFIGLEMASIPLGTLVAFNKKSKMSAEAGAKFILLSAFSSGILLFGISYLYGVTGSLYFSDVSVLLSNNPLQIMAFLFFLSGLFFKVSFVPFHLWTADVYEGAPTNVTSYLSVVSKSSAAFVLMILLFKLFGNYLYEWQTLLFWIIIVTITVGNLFALRQQNVKRFLAFSSISQAGYIALGIISGSTLGMTTVIYYIFVYLFSNLAAFGVITAIESRTRKINISDYKGLYHTNPKLSFVMMLAMFSLAGIAPFAGFMSKFFIFSAAAQQGYYLLVIIAVVNTIVSLYYYLMVVKAMFIDQNDHPVPALRTDAWNRASLVICTAAIIFVGLLGFLLDVIEKQSFGM
ncbi:NADH-quinone oxidoreductase subunit N [Proteiniphilum sp. UBA1028]|jgi:NADH-quinone oxidoreductase subunit N|uniref:NADH-quinone oxidoreductase subunit N n=1 Tax=Proteiniphilum sp. UBA1028 TaxID=1947251 RepID=UPI000E808345|nr:NADH-quinone oxidoreductase subunit N [Proteiniphilum sp. UBA1028]HBG58134.1 NADH-quinone oxidoreductase subunit N [Porphyromonadaceae bacterium]